jgi:anaerobic magnesium-protoporphyrin IX monomethyl ester cyclase
MGKVVSVIEAGHPSADGLASLFILLGYGALSLSSYLHQHGYRVKYFPMFTSTKLDWDYIESSDYVLISTMTHVAKIGYRIADRIRSRKGSKAVIVFGGVHPTVLPEDTLDHCDYVVMNEGEETALELLQALDSGTLDKIPSIEGLTYRDDSGRYVYTPRRAQMTQVDFPLEPELIHHWPGVAGNFLRTGKLRFPFPVVQFSRGCPFGCTFCLGMRQLGKLYRTRPAQAVIDDLGRLHGLTRFPYGMFHDNDIAIRKAETKDLLRSMIRAKLKIRLMSAFTRIDSTKDEELWRLFDEAGVRNVFFGVESLYQSKLDEYHKGTTVRAIHEAMQRIRSFKIRTKIVASFIVGDSEDPIKELALIREFFETYHEELQRVVIQPLMEYPTQTKMRGQHQLYPDEQFIHHDWDYFAGDFLVFYPRAVPASVLQQEILKTFRFIHGVPRKSRWNTDYQLTQGVIRYSHRDKDRRLRRYIDYLRQAEKGKYDCAGRLITERLVADQKAKNISI